MFFNARLSSLRPRPRHVSFLVRDNAVLLQCRGLNQFVSRVDSSEPQTPSPQPSSAKPIRLAVKDNITTSSLRTTCASGILASHTSPFEATVVPHLRARGAEVVGKTNLDEFGMGSHSTNSAFGAVQHDDSTAAPDGEQRSVGGSSGGSAVAVAQGEADLALGTDTGGSVRLPAAYCGVVGYKPSYGMVSRFGVVPYANSLDTVGFLARTVGPIWDVVLAGREDAPLWRVHDAKDPTSLSTQARTRCARARDFYDGIDELDGEGSRAVLGSLTFGVPLEYNIEELDPRIRDAWTRAAQRLQALGARVVPVSLPSTRHALSAYYVIAPAEASSNLAKYDGVRYGVRDADAADGRGEVLYSETRGAGFGDEVKRRILLGSYTLSSEAMDNYFMQAQRVRRLVRRDFDRVFRLGNPLAGDDGGERHFDLSELDERVPLESKLGPAQVDFLLCPTAPTPPPRLEEVMRQTPLDLYMNDVFTVPASLAGLPAVSVPMRLSGEQSEGGGEVGGLQLVGQYWDDARLLVAAHGLSEDPEI